MSRVAVFDIGTVTCRLGIFDVLDGAISSVVLKDLEICNLGSNVDAQGNLEEDSIDRVLSCMDGFVKQAIEHRADVCICTLTSAARDASNSSVLLSGLEKLGIIPQIITGDLEARLSFLGVAQDFPNQTIAVMDSGGGSTELCVGTLKGGTTLDIQWVHSYNVGARRLTERFFDDSAIQDEDARMKALQEARGIYSECMAPLDLSDVRLVGVGGTATTLCAIDKGMEVYNPLLVHLSCLSLDKIDQLGKWLSSLSVIERSEVKGLQPKRAEIIVGGVCSVEALMQVYNFNMLTISENDILCGLAIVADSSFNYEKNVVEWNAQLFKL